MNSGRLVGLALVTIIQPETAGGAILLIAIGLAATNVLITVVKLFFHRKEGASKDGSAAPIDKSD